VLQQLCQSPSDPKINELLESAEKIFQILSKMALSYQNDPDVVQRCSRIVIILISIVRKCQRMIVGGNKITFLTWRVLTKPKIHRIIEFVHKKRLSYLPFALILLDSKKENLILGSAIVGIFIWLTGWAYEVGVDPQETVLDSLIQLIELQLRD